ncbi:TRAP transporter small permease [Oceanomicrobium pacificus]|uniref:TRAP transporter small permease n=1 Tax=Oceanomicrobium pacificus TaxID=2692916 RepID=UPI001F27D85D|nr:TRAP transporter small permease subunit [Oceanomicrobium pacificus]
MALISALLRPLSVLNTWLLRLGRALAWVALGLMVAIILAQIFFRYVIGDAQNWTEEAARFLMLWMTGLAAPSAYRWGGFVAIDMAVTSLSRIPGLILQLFLLAICLAVCLTGVYFGWDHVTGFAGRFNSSSLRLPLDLVGGEAVKVKLAYMHAALFTCMVLMVLVTLELILSRIVALFDADADPVWDPDRRVVETD